MSEKRTYELIGHSLPRVDGREKVTGQAIYGTDFKLPGTLTAKVLRSPYPHARILNIDTSRAEKLVGVKAVITGQSFNFRPFGAAIRDTYFIAVDKVRYVGEPVAAVAAISQDVAEEALGLIEADYQELTPVFDPEEGMKPGAPLVHERLGEYGQAVYNRAIPGTNICNHFKLRKGEVEKGFAESYQVFERLFTIHKLQHCPMEPHAALARVDPGGKVTVWSTTQVPHILRLELAEAFSLPLNMIRVIATSVGGGFGAKSGTKQEGICAALALKSGGRPVKLVFSREEEFVGTVTRHPCQIKVKTGVKKDGTLVSREMVAVWDTGAYSERGERVSRKAGFSAPGPYKIPHVKVDSYCVYTNKVSAGAFRGFGDSQMAWAVEQQMDIIAEELKIDPLEIRLKNAYEEGSVSATGEVLQSVGLKESLNKAAEAVGWGEKKSGKAFGRGLGCIHKNTAAGTSSSVIVMLNDDGTASVLTSAMEIGQGSKTVLTQIAAEELGLLPSAISVSTADTDLTPYDFGSVSSRITFHTGNALIQAAKEARERLFELAAQRLEANPADLELGQGEVYIKGSPDRRISLKQIFSPSSYHGARRGYVMGRGSFMPLDEEMLHPETGQSKKPTAFWMYAAQAAQVEVDTETGEVRILKIAAAHDLGKALNPLICQGQIEGSLAFGVGAALMEEMVLEGGKVLNPSFMDYLLPTALDVPAFVPILVETPHPQGPYGAKGFADAAVCAVEPAVANAIYDAVGVRMMGGPMTPEKVLRALKAKPHG